MYKQFYQANKLRVNELLDPTTFWSFTRHTWWARAQNVHRSALGWM